MSEQAPIVFKTEASIWDMMLPVNPDGRSAKPFDMRRWDLADDRIYRLAWGTLSSVFFEVGKEHDRIQNGPDRRPSPTWEWVPDEIAISFLNKATGELLTFEYLGVEFEDWAPGWGFLILGKRLVPPVEE